MSAMQFIGVLAGDHPPPDFDLPHLEMLERIGKVELQQRWQGGMRCRLELGEWQDCELILWGHGKTASEAINALVAKLVSYGIVQALRDHAAEREAREAI